jgi:hypothetical protein
MIMATVVAVALGVAPLKENGAAELVAGDYSAQIGRYSQRIDVRGVTHLSGFSPRDGAPFDITVAPDGHVEATVGDRYVTFEISKPS